MSRWLTILAASAFVAGAFSTVASREVTAQSVSTVVGGFSGSEQFGTYCAACHGSGARGDGPLAAQFRRRPPDLTAFASRNGGIFEPEVVFKIIDGREPVKGHGGGDMPVWGDSFALTREGANPEQVKARIESIVRWLATIQRQ